jgi:twitching motility protein PilJ
MSVDRLKRFFSKTVLESDSGSRHSQQETSIQPEGDSTQTQVAPVTQRDASPGAVLSQPAGDDINLPVLGTRPANQHQQILLIGLAVSLILLGAVAAFALRMSDQVGQQMGAIGQSLMQSQRLAKSVAQAVVGNSQAFADVQDSASVLSRASRGLKSGDDTLRLDPLDATYQDALNAILPRVERAEKSAASVIAQQKVLTQIGASLRQINRQSGDLLEIAESVAALKVQQNAPGNEIEAAGQLVMLTQRIGKSSTEFLTIDGVSADAVFLMGKDLTTFSELAQGLLQGSAELRLPAARDPQTRQRLEALVKQFDQTRTQASAVLANLQGLVAAREAQAVIVNDSEPLRQSLEQLQQRLGGGAGIGAGSLVTLALAAALAVLCAVGLAYIPLVEGRKRQLVAELQMVDAERLQQDARRVNDANQAAILRLMNELQTVAEGDLTQQATVTEDITGAIADSVNYTVEELRTLVASVQNTASRVAQTTAEVDSASTELLAASNEQMNEIQATGKSVLEMATRINTVSSQAQESAMVARQSLHAAESGLSAVQNAIGGMNAIRDQIQDTSKRIKRLGESSQEIGEITELISDITEQTNVLALNAAIQAASAGEAGRGFSVVAEEVQRLAERSADATRQITALVRAIQTDTQDAVAAMERSTQGVVEGAKLSDNAGARLAEIDQVSRQLSELIQQISDATLREANLANAVADSIQNIFAVTEQTSDGTRATAGQVRELSRMAEELRQSVARFKIA